MHILDLKNVRCYIIQCDGGYLAFDLGWPDSQGLYKAALKAAGLGLGDIRWAVASHYHIDHAGLAGWMQGRGTPLVVFDNQASCIEGMEKLIARGGYRYSPVDRAATVSRPLATGRAFLSSIGIAGGFEQCDSHCEDSIALILDSGDAFVGDLPPPDMYSDFDEAVTRNWDALKERGAARIFPAHAAPFVLADDAGNT